jgi:hypothetical protein
MFNPQWVIDEALYRVLTQSHVDTVPTTAESASSHDTDSYPATPRDTDEDFGNQQQRYEPYHEHTPELWASLQHWAQNNSLHQQEHLRFEDEMGAKPAYQALHVLHGPLNSFIDYVAMVSQGIQNFRHPVLSLSILDDASLVSDEEYSPAISPSSLDYSLPMSPLPDDTDSISSEVVQEDRQIEMMHPGLISNKRKNPDGEEGDSSRAGGARNSVSPSVIACDDLPLKKKPSKPQDSLTPVSFA